MTRPTLTLNDGVTALQVTGRTQKQLPYGHPQFSRLFEALHGLQQDGGFTSVELKPHPSLVSTQTEKHYLFTATATDGRVWEQHLVYSTNDKHLRQAWLRSELWTEAEVQALTRLREILLAAIQKLDLEEVQAQWQ